MNKRNFFCRTRIVATLLAGFFLIPALRAQNSENRFLFIFETSPDMKRRVSAEGKALDEMLVMSMNGQLREGDSVGVWTFSDAARAGEFPLQNWDTENAATISSDIAAFVKQQHYTKQGKFDAMLPLLNRVVKDSERLTVVIFCDGEEEIHGTSFDAGINQIFAQRQGERKKTRQPFIIILRSQLGSYVGCTVNFPPSPVSLPQFPPFPEPAPAPPPKIINAPPKPAPIPQAAPLIIIWTNHPAKSPISEPPTNQPSAVSTSTPPMIVEQKMAQMSVARTNVVAGSTDDSASDGNEGALIFGLGLLVAAGVLVAVVWQRSREATHSSLITRSMHDDKNLPPKN